MIIRKYILLLFFLIITSYCHSQDSRPSSNIIQNHRRNIVSYKNNATYHYGYRFKLSNQAVIRIRTYSNDALQITFIIGKTYQLRIYYYFNIPEYNITPAISFRINI
jgi:hypothetical protein